MTGEVTDTSAAAAGIPADTRRPEDLSAYPSFRLPLFPRFTPALRRPGIEQEERRCRQWLADHLPGAFDDKERLQEFLQHRTTLWNLLVYATAGADRVALICHWIDVLFSIDDAFAQKPPSQLRRLGIPLLPAVLDGRPIPGQTTYTAIFHMLREQSMAVMPPGVWERYAHTLKGFLHACQREKELVKQADTIDLATYEAYRAVSIGECCFPLAEFGLGIDLTHATAQMPELQRLNTLVGRHWIAVNDIFSYRKELYSGDTMNEIQLALADNGGDLQHAVDRVVATVHRVEDDFQQLCAQLRARPHGQAPDITAYLKALEWMIAGNLEWSYITPRYNGRTHHLDGPLDATVILTPSRTHYIPE
ncbi:MULTISPECIES: terpene synthase family protein [Streptomyces]|uniref:terpene synthase family protein n=1 Tax=Streptomyces TaxID=1883 RepID=UPI0007CD977B|nr:hypothetical protein A4V12_29405 [Streptomyces noursei]